MTHVILLWLFYQIFILSNLISGDKFIGNFLSSKVRNHLVSTSNGTNHKLWMKYLEKRLQKISMYVSMQQLRKRQTFSVVQFYKSHLQRAFLKEVLTLCTKKIHKTSNWYCWINLWFTKE